MSYSNISRKVTPAKQPNRTAKRRKLGPSPARRKTKQETVLALLRRSKGATIAAIMKATAWQEHLVRSFFVAIVLKKLGMTLTSKRVDGARVYSVTPGPIASKPASAVA